MLAMLKEYVPTNGPPKQNQNMSKHLNGNIFEFKRGPKAGRKYRVLYFFDERNVVVCTTAFTKGEKTPDGVIDAAENIRTDYLNAKKSKKLDIVKLDWNYRWLVMSIKKYADLFAKVETSEEYLNEMAIIDFTEDIIATMERLQVSRSDLAKRLGTSQAYVTKVLRGNVNFTLGTMTRLAHALGAVVRVHISPRGATTRWMDSINGATSIPAAFNLSGEENILPAEYAVSSKSDSNNKPIQTVEWAN